jgi:protein O-GlcNAc transferase
VQCVTWGHPVTTGIEAIDYFISSDDLEIAESDQHYTERLVRLRNLAIYYYRPALSSELSGVRSAEQETRRAAFSLPTTGCLYGCPQSLLKLHPDFDEIIAGILRRDLLGSLVLLKGARPVWEQSLRQRFETTMPDVVDRIRFVPRQDYLRFLELNSLIDVLLDPLHFGGGNTSYEGLAMGVPIVTLPSQFLRGRITWALYRQMGVLDCVVNSAQEYIDRAVQLGTDHDYRATVKAKIAGASELLFENSAGVRELEMFLRQAVDGAPGLP